MKLGTQNLDLSEAVNYHYGQFPPASFDYAVLIEPTASAAAALARYDQMLKAMHNSEILLAPLRNQEAVVSSRMEGTVSTLDEVLRYEADQEEAQSNELANYRSEAKEVALYGTALRRAQKSVKEGHPISSVLLRGAHSVLLGFGHGAHNAPGEFKTEQNYLVDRAKRKVRFIPISPEQLAPSMDALFDYIHQDTSQVLIRTAVAHLEFEALHPFKDGNGRVGRMLITLCLWRYGIVAEPHFYISSFFEDNRDEYIDRMRDVSRSGDWTPWVLFFLKALETQAKENLEKAEQIRQLYEKMKDDFRKILSSQWSTSALDFLFERPVFRNNVFTTKSGIPSPTAHRFSRILIEQGILRTLVEPAGRRAGLYSFEPLLELVRS
ncbi:Fic family protein [Mesorhizobium sp. NBSH29]|uniref:Fic family protein n=1 Tax=Mesorhizobium sp. NBSH29 TaxID=2654249 RepID=UPI0018967175|nr:Fic/DOC family N-terminal domain-containing protein [Mesorhizobium sp. NBSH29]QPC87254.1 Fic family protein [Mesorhizobium sp. NBSH29]